MIALGLQIRDIGYRKTSQNAIKNFNNNFNETFGSKIQDELKKFIESKHFIDEKEMKKTIFDENVLLQKKYFNQISHQQHAELRKGSKNEKYEVVLNRNQY